MNIIVDQMPVIFFRSQVLIWSTIIHIQMPKRLIIYYHFLPSFLQLACSGAAVVLSTYGRWFPQRRHQIYISNLLKIHMMVKQFPFKKKPSGQLTAEAAFFCNDNTVEIWNDPLTFIVCHLCEVYFRSLYLFPPCYRCCCSFSFLPTFHTHSHLHQILRWTFTFRKLVL